MSNNSTSSVVGYVMFPYHQALPHVGFSDYLSIDKAKYFRGTAVGRQSYVPRIATATSVVSAGGSITAFYKNYVWRPILPAPAKGESKNTLPRLYTGACVFGGNAQTTGTAYYTIKTDVYLTFYNQNCVAK